ncbi:hypothetical protein [Streptomyces sp. SID8352]|uniref:hypothetical protein n=1 Tax=Streptomyces sp. SID8352 TaxID=2690338 RepID=UPI001370A0DB|nr:hypothetical protein [Streptomyces sp. SID8352]MYU23076.1 hypothetical protein [Streptomyces sp. SID8352]
MWPGEQSSAGGPGRPNPYHQPGYQQQPPPPAGGGPAPWNAPTVTAVPAATTAPPAGGGPSRPGGGRTGVIATVAAAAVVVAASVTGIVLLGGGGDDRADPAPPASSSAAPEPPASASPAADDRRDGDDGPRPTVDGWKTVVNPALGVAFDVPAAWALKPVTWVSWVTDDQDPDEKMLVGMKAPAVLKEKWCGEDADRDGRVEHTGLAAAGTRGNKDARTTEEIARHDSSEWVFGSYAQPDRGAVTTGPVSSFTTTSGITGSIATSRSAGAPKKGRCGTEGKATTFAFRSGDGALVSWSFTGAAGVGDEVPDGTVRRIAATVREYTPSET